MDRMAERFDTASSIAIAEGRYRGAHLIGSVS
jgi:hypothetical protein